MEMYQIEKLTYSLSKSRSVLTIRTRTLEDDITNIKNKRLRGIKSALKQVLEDQSKLAEAIESAPELFEKPRTATFHGIRVGLQKGRGKIEYGSDDQVIKLIKKHLPEKQDLLIDVVEKLMKKVLEQLTAQELKKIGCSVVAAEDQVLIKPTDSAIDKLVNALMKDLEKLDEAEAL